MKTLCTTDRIRIFFDGQRIAFERLDKHPAQDADLEEAEAVLELMTNQKGGNC